MTLKEIAARVGTSPSTVSRVLNGYQNNFSVTPELKAQIMREVERSGYMPNPVFRSLRSTDNRQISFMFYDHSILRTGTVVSEALDAIAAMLLENGFRYNYTFAPEARAKTYPLPHWKMAGLIIPDVIDPRELSIIETNNYPYVVVNGNTGAQGTAVMSDEIANMRLIMEYLINYGHRRIGYIDARYIRDSYIHYSMVERKQGYCELMKKYQLPEIHGYFYKDSDASTPMRQMIEQNVTAIITYDDVVAQKLLYEAWRNGIRIPEQLSVVAFNNPDAFDYSIPPLTCLEVPARKIGAVAGETILRKITDPDFARGVTTRLPGRLVIRESVAAISKPNNNPN